MHLEKARSWALPDGEAVVLLGALLPQPPASAHAAIAVTSVAVRRRNFVADVARIFAFVSGLIPGEA
jgi:hypothetical protein